MNLERAKAISTSMAQEDGGWSWQREAECKWLAEQAGQHKRILELGSWRGTTAVAMADNTEGIVTCVDTWDGGMDQACAASRIAHPGDWVFEAFLKHTAHLKNLKYIRGLSTAVAASLAGSTFDMIFIDADHDYANVKADILAWRPLLVEGGLLCGHDFIPEPGRENTFPGVLQAVRELVPGHYVVLPTTIWRAP